MPIIPKGTRPYWNKKLERPPQSGRNFVNPWYNTRAWRALRESVIRDNPLCVNCLKLDRTTPANVVDHIKPVSTGHTNEAREKLMWSRENLQPLCHSCHNSKSGKENTINKR